MVKLKKKYVVKNKIMKKKNQLKERNNQKKNKEVIQNLRKTLIYLKENYPREVVDKRRCNIRY